MRMFSLAAGLVLSLAASLPVVAQTVAVSASQAFAAPAGPRFQGTATVRGRVVPLPPGEWVEFARHTWTGSPRDAAFSYEDVGLARLAGAGVDALILLRTIDYDGGYSVRTWARSPVCNRTNTYFAQVAVRDEQDQACMLLNHVSRAGNLNESEVWPRYAALREGRPQYFPTNLISAAYRFASGRGATTLTYFFGVERHGFPVQPTSWAESSWHRDRIDAPRRALVDQYQAWMAANFETVRQGVEQGRAVRLTPTP